MHPEIARQVIAQHHHDLHALARGGPRRRRAVPRIIPYWRITWSRVAAPASGGEGRAWLIVISARSARRMAGAR